MYDNLSNLPTVPVAEGAEAPADEFVWPVGAVIEGRYRVEEVLGGPGHSGMGIVYILNSRDGRVAAKTFQQQFAMDHQLIQRFLREAATWMLIGFHPNIVRAYGIDIIEVVPYLFMEYVERDPSGAVSLADRLARRKLAIPEILDLAIQCCDGMVHAESAVPDLVHRDLKPENLLIAPDGALKITDFGLVRCRMNQRTSGPPDDDASQPTGDGSGSDGLGLTQSGSAIGTPAYMAPEQFVDAENVTRLADIYAFGCCFYEAIAGRRLFTIRSSTPMEHITRAREMHRTHAPVPLEAHRPDCPASLDEVIMTCLEKDPANRWADFADLRERLKRVLKDEFGIAYTPRSMPPPAPRDVANQMRSLTLLDGYNRAVGMRHLRAHRNRNPYAFHLALASYFRTHGEPEEELRQLRKAARVRGRERGYEVVRRLADRLVEDGELDEAGALMDEFLARRPDDVDFILEPYVAWLIARREWDRAERLLADHTPSLRVEQMQVQLYRASGRLDRIADLRRRRAHTVIDNLRRTIAAIAPGDQIGWDQPGDPDLLKQILADAAPDIDLAVFDRVEHIYWPDMAACPDFSADMAWLSVAAGDLADPALGAPEPERARYARWARILGHPRRIERYVDRDELRLWTGEPDNPAAAPVLLSAYPSLSEP